MISESVMILILMIMLFALAVLCGGDPDLLDAIALEVRGCDGN